MSWWQNLQKSFTGGASPLKKNASKNLDFVKKTYGEMKKEHGPHLARKSDNLTSQLKKSAIDYGKRAQHVPETLRSRSMELGKQGRKLAEETTTRLGEQAGNARTLPSKAAVVSLVSRDDNQPRCSTKSSTVLLIGSAVRLSCKAVHGMPYDPACIKGA